MPSPIPTPQKIKGKERKYFPNIPQRLLNSWQDMQIIFAKKKIHPCKLQGIYPAFSQGSKYNQRLREEWGKMVNHSGFPVISVSL